MKIKTNSKWLLGVAPEDKAQEIEVALKGEVEKLSASTLPDDERVLLAIQNLVKTFTKPEQMNLLYFILGAYFQKNALMEQMNKYATSNPESSSVTA